MLYPIILTALIIILIASCKKSDNSSSTPPAETVMDIDGNVYHTVIIGSQVWMVENLKTTKYNNGNPIPYIPDSASWKSLTIPGYCRYNTDPSSNKEIYGALYNWYAVSTGNLAPTGWHVPTMTEWTTLIYYLGGIDIVGANMKETGTSHWLSPNTGAINSSGFTALPGGAYDGSNGVFRYIQENGYWWSVSEITILQGLSWGLAYNTAAACWMGAELKRTGFSVRCIKN